MNEIAHIAVDPVYQNLYWTENDQIKVSSFSRNRPKTDHANFKTLFTHTEVGHRIHALHYDTSSKLLLVFETPGRSGTLEISTVERETKLDTQRMKFENFNMENNRFIQDIIPCNDQLNIFLISSSGDNSS